MLRFSHCAVAVGQVPSTGKAETGQPVAVAGEHERRDLLDESGRLGRDDGRPAPGRRRPRRAPATSARPPSAASTRREVALQDLGALLRVGVRDRLLDPGDRGLGRQRLRDREEAGLHDRVDAPLQARLARDAEGVDDEEAQLPRDDLLLHLAAGARPRRRRGRRASSAGTRAPSARGLEDVVAVDELELVAGDEAGAADEVRRADRPRPEAQVRDRDGARLLRVVDEVALREAVGLLAEDLDRVLVGADRAVGAEAVEDRARDVGRLDVEVGVERRARCA